MTLNMIYTNMTAGNLPEASQNYTITLILTLFVHKKSSVIKSNKIKLL